MKKYVLETTPLDRNTSKTETLLLGEWCNLNAENRGFKVVDYHWNDRKKLRLDHQRILSLYEIYLKKLTISLNTIHHVDYTVDYWRILVGPWLYVFICIVFDRYQMLFKASNFFNIEYTLEPQYEADRWIPLDYSDFKNKFESDDWNYYIYSEIIKYSKIVSTKKSNYQLIPNKLNKGYQKYKVLKSLLFLLTKLSNTTAKNIVFTEIGIPQLSLYKLLFRLRNFSFSYYLRVKPKVFKLKNDLRKFFFENNSSNEFEKILDNLIPINIPISYIEGYENLLKDSKKIFPKKVKLIITSNAYFSNEHFKVWCATQKLNNSKLWVFVHGGNHGTALFNGSAKLSEDIADRFYSWGWGKYNLPSSKLSMLRNHKVSQTGDKFLFISFNVSKYSWDPSASPIGPSFSDCIKMHSSFFNKISAYKSKEDIVIRLKGGKDLWNLKLEYEKCGIQNFVSSVEETLLESISKSKLVIVSYDSTVFLEALTLNVPTCLFFRKDYWERSASSAKFFEKFVDCGILHNDEDSLINHIFEINNDYLGWWHSDLVQQSISSFLNEYGLSSNLWEEDWHNEVQNGLKEINI